MPDNYCTICGKFHSGSACPTVLDTLNEQNNIGWECPVCGCGNAPHALSCGNCVSKVGPVLSAVPAHSKKTNFQQKVNQINNVSPAFIEVEST